MTVEKMSAVGETVSEALEKIANEMSLSIQELDFEIDSEQFISENGQPMGLREFEVSAWKRIPKEGAAEMEAWLNNTFVMMGIEATVSARVSGNRLIFSIESEQGGQIIGRKGSTLRSIQALMEETSTKAGYDWTFSLQVAGGEERKERRSRNDDRRDNRRDGRRDGRRDNRRGNRDDDNLKRLATKLANKVLETSEPIVIEKELNGYQRRIVHMVIKDFDGVDSESFNEGEQRKIRLVLSSTDEG